MSPSFRDMKTRASRMVQGVRVRDIDDGEDDPSGARDHRPNSDLVQVAEKIIRRKRAPRVPIATDLATLLSEFELAIGAVGDGYLTAHRLMVEIRARAEQDAARLAKLSEIESRISMVRELDDALTKGM